MDIICVTLDCADPARVAEFWNAALGWGGVAAAPDGSGDVWPEMTVVLGFTVVLLALGAATLRRRTA